MRDSSTEGAHRLPACPHWRVEIHPGQRAAAVIADAAGAGAAVGADADAGAEQRSQCIHLAVRRRPLEREVALGI